MKWDPTTGTLTLHQSDIGAYIKCPEQFRQVNHLGSGQMPEPDLPALRTETDAATIGTTLHSVIERELTKGPYASLDSAQKQARQMMGNLIRSYLDNEVEYRCESYGPDPSKALGVLDRLVADWWRCDDRQYWLQRDRDSYLVEWNFNVPFVTRTAPTGTWDDPLIRKIRLGGMADIIDLSEHRVVDWKSTGRKYQRWEKQRWDVQPTVYTFAAMSAGLIQPNSAGDCKFEYHAFLKGNADEVPQIVTTYRSQGQWAWLTQLVNNIADMCESNAKVWPLTDNHALCGPKWCPVWTVCKGAFVDDHWK